MRPWKYNKNTGEFLCNLDEKNGYLTMTQTPDAQKISKFDYIKILKYSGILIFYCCCNKLSQT